jgi:hypothetical protein
LWQLQTEESCTLFFPAFLDGRQTNTNEFTKDRFDMAQTDKGWPAASGR